MSRYLKGMHKSGISRSLSFPSVVDVRNQIDPGDEAPLIPGQRY